MGKTEVVRARIEPHLKRDAEAVLKKVGLTSSEAITLFYKQIELTQGLPFPIRIPNRTTRKAITDARARKGLETFPSVKDWARKARVAR